MGDHELIHKLTNFVLSRLDDKNLGADDLVRVALTSRANLYRKLRRIEDQSVNGFILQLRLQEAQRLLKDCPRHSIREISERVGFSDQSYFSRTFKEYYGLPPLKYQQMMQKGKEVKRY